MCCRACTSYELCKVTGKLQQDDCCQRCQYFASCMEEVEETEEKTRSPSRRTARR